MIHVINMINYLILNEHDSDQHEREFCATKVTKYFKDQKPPTNENEIFNDPKFPASNNSLMGYDNNGNIFDPVQYAEKAGDMNPEQIKWKRVSEIFTKFELFEGSIEFNDIKQGNLGNCYFLSALAALTEFPNLIFKIFKTQEVPTNGLYEVALFIDGEWQIVIVDDYIPVNIYGDPAFAKPNGNEIWVMILEKAWAKVNGGYLNIIGGFATEALTAFTGFSKRFITVEAENIEEIWNTVSEAETDNNIMCCGTRSTQEAEDMGLVGGHAYTLISSKSATDDSDKLIRLFEIRNPWGNKEWKGEWSDNSPLWNERLNKIFGKMDNKDDGKFFIKVEDFCKYFKSLYICYTMYNSNIKIYNFEKEKILIDRAQTFSLNMKRTSVTTITINAPYYRYNRHLRDKSHPISLILAKVDPKDNSLKFIDGDFSSEDDPSIKKLLFKGKYLIWVYYNTNDQNERPVNNMMLRICSTTKFVSNYEKKDPYFRILSKIIASGVSSENPQSLEKGEKFGKVENQFKSTGIGYYVKYNNTDSHMSFSANTSGILNMTMLYPSVEKEFEVFGPPNSTVVILAMKQKFYAQTWFNVPVSCYTKNTPFDKDHDKGGENQFSNSLKLPALINDEILNKDVDDHFYDYVSPSIKDAKLCMEFRHIDLTDLKKEEFRNEYPIHMQKLQEIPDDLNYKQNDWKKIVFENGVYLGQVDTNGQRTGKGLYIFASGLYIVGYFLINVRNGLFREYNNDHSCYFDGNYVNGIKNGKGKTIFNDGSYYLGEFKNDVRHGYGEYWFPSGQRYIGNWADGKKSGKGCYYYNDNEWWDGYFTNNLFNGKGTYHFASGNTQEITYKDNKQV
jgi:hypothetical protein